MPESIVQIAGNGAQQIGKVIHNTVHQSTVVASQIAEEPEFVDWFLGVGLVIGSIALPIANHPQSFGDFLWSVIGGAVVGATAGYFLGWLVVFSIALLPIALIAGLVYVAYKFYVLAALLGIGVTLVFICWTVLKYLRKEGEHVDASTISAIASGTMGFLSPYLGKVAEGFTKKTGEGLYHTLKSHLSQHDDVRSALDEAASNPNDLEVSRKLEQHLEAALKDDPKLALALVKQLQRASASPEGATVINQSAGDNAKQIGEVHTGGGDFNM